MEPHELRGFSPEQGFHDSTPERNRGLLRWSRATAALSVRLFPISKRYSDHSVILVSILPLREVRNTPFLSLGHVSLSTSANDTTKLTKKVKLEVDSANDFPVRTCHGRLH